MAAKNRDGLRSTLNREEKQKGFQKAFRRINEFVAVGNYIAAYVLTFSIIEDRLTAIYLVRRYLSQGKDVNPKWVSLGGGEVQKIISQDLSPKLQEEIRTAFNNRNIKVHGALWRHEEFSKEDVESLKKLARSIDAARRKQKKNLKI